jgi:peptide/nickel transport system permease protein
MRLADVFLAFPQLFVLILISTLLRGLNSPIFTEGRPLVIAFSIGILSWMPIARLVRATVLSLSTREYVTATRALGAKNCRIILKHILPNSLSPIIVEATLLVAYSILTEAGLSFIGFGVHPRIPTWGNMLHEGQSYLLEYPWLSIAPGAVIFLTVISINYIGDGIRDTFDPHKCLSFP